MTFCAVMALTVGLLQGGIAKAYSYLTVAGHSCIQWNGTYVNTIWCGLPGGSSIVPAGIDVAYFDYHVDAAGTTTQVDLSLYKEKIDGTIYMDYTTSYDSYGNHDSLLTASKVNTANLVWDYWYTSIAAKNLSNSTNFYGVGIRTK